MKGAMIEMKNFIATSVHAAFVIIKTIVCLTVLAFVCSCGSCIYFKVRYDNVSAKLNGIAVNMQSKINEHKANVDREADKKIMNIKCQKAHLEDANATMKKTIAQLNDEIAHLKQAMKLDAKTIEHLKNMCDRSNYENQIARAYNNDLHTQLSQQSMTTRKSSRNYTNTTTTSYAKTPVSDNNFGKLSDYKLRRF